jgi:hypothetical protein
MNSALRIPDLDIVFVSNIIVFAENQFDGSFWRNKQHFEERGNGLSDVFLLRDAFGFGGGDVAFHAMIFLVESVDFGVQGVDKLLKFGGYVEPALLSSRTAFSKKL